MIEPSVPAGQVAVPAVLMAPYLSSQSALSVADSAIEVLCTCTWKVTTALIASLVAAPEGATPLMVTVAVAHFCMAALLLPVPLTHALSVNMSFWLPDTACVNVQVVESGLGPKTVLPQTCDA